MKLPPQKVMPSLAALRDYGNTSGSTTYYCWSYVESVQNVKKGHIVLQAGVGSGIKAGINIWKALRDIHDNHPAWVHLNGTPLTDADLPRSLVTSHQAAVHAGMKKINEEQAEGQQAGAGHAKHQLTNAIELHTGAMGMAGVH